MNPASSPRTLVLLGLLPSIVLCTACSSWLPVGGPARDRITATAPAGSTAAFRFVDVDETVVARLEQRAATATFADSLGVQPAAARQVGVGDILSVWIWEAPPALLFGESSGPSSLLPASGPSAANASATPSLASSNASRAAGLPDQVVDEAGTIFVPFAGRIPAAGRTLEQIAGQVRERLAGKANQPEVIVNLARGNSATATVVGEVTTTTRVPLVPGGDRLLDALASASGVKTPLEKTVIQITRGSLVAAMPLESVVRDPRQNVPLHAGDVVAALYQPYAFTALGASAKNGEVPFEARGISLAQALARCGGLLDERASPQGVFVFRFEQRSALEGVPDDAPATADGRIPVVYRIDLSKPTSLFVIQDFPVRNQDVLYIANAPSTDLQKFLTILVQAAFPISVGHQSGL